MGDASHALTDVSLLETCVLLSVGNAWLRVGDASFTAGDTCHELTCASYEETSRSQDVGSESLGVGNDRSRVRGDPVHAGDVSLRVQDAFYARRDVSLAETSLLVSASGAWMRAADVLFAQPGRLFVAAPSEEAGRHEYAKPPCRGGHRGQSDRATRRSGGLRRLTDAGASGDSTTTSGPSTTASGPSASGPGAGRATARCPRSRLIGSGRRSGIRGRVAAAVRRASVRRG